MNITKKQFPWHLPIWLFPVAFITYLGICPQLIYIRELGLCIYPQTLFFCAVLIVVAQLRIPALKIIFLNGGIIEVAYALLPIEVFLACFYAQRHLWIVVVLQLAALISAAAIIQYSNGDGNKSQRSMYHLLHFSGSFGKAELYVRILALMMCLFFLIPSLSSVFRYKLESPLYRAMSSLAELDTENRRDAIELESKQYAIANCKALEKLDNNIWDTLDLSQKTDLLQIVADIETKDLGISSAQIQCQKLQQPDLMGKSYYDGEGMGIITLDTEFVAKGSNTDCVKTVLHECRHLFQRYVVSKTDFKDKFGQCAYFDLARSWKDNLDSYIPSGSGYNTQPVELDAFAYSEDQLPLYFPTGVSNHQPS